MLWRGVQLLGAWVVGQVIGLLTDGIVTSTGPQVRLLCSIGGAVADLFGMAWSIGAVALLTFASACSWFARVPGTLRSP